MIGVYFLSRAQAARMRSLALDGERPVIAPTRRLTPLLEPADGPAPAKLSPADAERLLGIPLRVHR